MALVLPRNWCLIFFRDPKAEFTPVHMKQVLQDAGLTVRGNQQPFDVRCSDGPRMSVSLHRGAFTEGVISGLVGSRRKYRKLMEGCDAQIKIDLWDLDKALDEINTLIEVQASLQVATQGLMYMSWNQKFAAPADA
jgi:hypothetical protein